MSAERYLMREWSYAIEAVWRCDALFSFIAADAYCVIIRRPNGPALRRPNLRRSAQSARFRRSHRDAPNDVTDPGRTQTAPRCSDRLCERAPVAHSRAD